MTSWYECTLNGAPLSDVAENIFLYDIIEAPAESITSTPKSISNGSTFVRQQRESLTVTLRLAIREQDTAKRMEAFAAVQQWAKGGGILTRSDREGQQLAVECVMQPSMASALKWTELVDLTFVAHGDPYWQGVEPVSVTLTGSGSIAVPGTANTAKATAIITPTGNLTAVTIKTGASTIALEDMDIPQGQTVVIGYDADGYLYMESGGDSLLLYRTVTSSDELRVLCGGDTVTVTADTDVSVQLTARGAWL